MATKIFFSWQSDSPNATNRSFIEDALEKAIKQLKSDIKLEVPLRDDLELDMDTKNVPGSPPIVETIFEKISNCTIFVPDLTFIGTSTKGRKIPNPNVLIEYGWALKALSHSRIIPIMNSAFLDPTPEALPFDMRHLTMPKLYTLPEGTEQADRTKEKERLIKILTKSIADILKHISTPPPPPPPALFQARPHTYTPSMFIQQEDRLATQHDEFTGEDRHVYIQEGSHIFLRLMPKYEQHTFENVDLKEIGENGKVQLLGQPPRLTNSAINTLGFVIYKDTGGRKTRQAVQLFTSGEIWAITEPYIDHQGKQAPVPIETFEKYFTDALAHFRALMVSHLKLHPPFIWLAGLTGVKGRIIQLPSTEQSSQPIPEARLRYQVESIEYTNTLNEHDSVEDALKPFFERIYGTAGLRRSQFIQSTSR